MFVVCIVVAAVVVVVVCVFHLPLFVAVSVPLLSGSRNYSRAEFFGPQRLRLRAASPRSCFFRALITPRHLPKKYFLLWANKTR